MTDYEPKKLSKQTANDRVVTLDQALVIVKSHLSTLKDGKVLVNVLEKWIRGV